MIRTLPFISIIVPTLNRPQQLQVCLTAISCLEYPRDRLEVIVVDDGGQTSLDQAVAGLRGQLALHLLRQSNRGPAAARNYGASHAQGEFLAFTDDDCVPSPNWLQSMAGRLASKANCAVGGRTVNALPENRYSAVSQLLIDYLYAYYNSDHEHATFLTSNNLAVPRTLLESIGRFDTSFRLAGAEDRDLCDRWLHHGLRIIYAPEARVYHHHPMTLRSFWQQHSNYGRGAFYFRRVRAVRNGSKIGFEPLRFYTNLLLYPYTSSSERSPSITVGLLAVAQLANLLGYFRERSANWYRTPLESTE